MKRIIIFILFTCCILSFLSCSPPSSLPLDLSKSENDIDPFFIQQFPIVFSYSDEISNVTKEPMNIKQGQQVELFSNIQIYSNLLYVYLTGSSMLRFNPMTGNVTSVCQSPLCSHNSQACPFIGLDAPSFRIFDNKIYFSAIKKMRSDRGNGYGYYVYDIENMSISISPAHHSESALRMGEVLITSDGQQYYYDCIYKPESDSYIYNICKYDPSTNKTIILGEPQDANTVLIDKIDTVLYYLDGIGLGIYDESNGTKKELYHGFAGNVGHDDTYFYFRNEDDFLYRLPIGGNVAEKLTDFPVRYYYITEDYIYYKIDESVALTYSPTNKSFDIGSQTIYRMSKDGDFQEAIFKFDNQLSTMNCDYFVVLGNYIYSKFYYWDGPTDTVVESHNRSLLNGNSYLIRIDLTTKEVYFINMTS